MQINPIPPSAPPPASRRASPRSSDRIRSAIAVPVNNQERNTFFRNLDVSRFSAEEIAYFKTVGFEPNHVQRICLEKMDLDRMAERWRSATMCPNNPVMMCLDSPVS